MDSLFNSALQYLSRRSRSEREVREYLKKKIRKKQVSPDKIEKVIVRLKELRFLDDEAFAKWMIEQRTRVKPKGWSAIAFELRQKGISDELIFLLHANIRESGERDERTMAMALTQKKIKTMQRLSQEKIYQRLGGFLSRRGFSPDVIRSVFDEVLRKSV